MAMPSLYEMLQRYPDEMMEAEDGGLIEIWQNVMDADFTAFGEHLSESGCMMLDYTNEDGIFNANVGKGEAAFRFAYDSRQKKATLSYPKGVYDGELEETEQTYQNALGLISAGEYADAAGILLGIKGYKDVETILETDENIAVVVLLAQFEVGKIVSFGSYEQDDNTSNGKEAIEWIVLANDGHMATMISRYALDCVPYNTSKASVTWMTCSLRKWLNSTFLNTAFTQDEQEWLQTVTVTADKNPEYSTEPGRVTLDKVYLLSIPEVNKYISLDKARICVPTAYAKAQGVYTKSGVCWWWLRSPGGGSNCAARVDVDGSVDYGGYGVNHDREGVRPVVVLRLS